MNVLRWFWRGVVVVFVLFVCFGVMSLIVLENPGSIPDQQVYDDVYIATNYSGLKSNDIYTLDEESFARYQAREPGEYYADESYYPPRGMRLNHHSGAPKKDIYVKDILHIPECGRVSFSAEKKKGIKWENPICTLVQYNKWPLWGHAFTVTPDGHFVWEE